MKTIFWLSLILILSLPTILKAQPAVNIGADTTVCGDSLVLDAQNPLALSWTWSTGETTQMITADSSGLYWVEVADVSGTTRDSIVLEIYPVPSIIVAPVDTFACSGLFSFIAQGSGGSIIQWIDSAGSVFALGDTLLYNLQDTTKMWFQASHYNTAAVGLNVNPPNSFFGAASGRGLFFNTTEYVILDSVTINVSTASFSGDIVLEDGLAQVIASIPVSLSSSGQHTIYLGLEIPVGSYGLYMRNIAGGAIQQTFPFSNFGNLSYPFLSITGSTNANVYPYFYDWKVRKPFDCSSPLDSVVISELKSGVINLGVDTSLCSDSLLLDATNIGSGVGYLWNTGATTATVWATTTNQYKVTVTVNGNCPVEDSIFVSVNTKPVFIQTPSDTSLCTGSHLLIAATNTGVIQWMDSSGAILHIGDSLVYNVVDTSTIWYKGTYYLMEPSHVGLDINAPNVFMGGASNRGINFTTNEYLFLDSVTINIDNAAFVGDIVLRDINSTAIGTVSVSNLSVGANTIYLGFSIPPASGYTLYMENLSGGNIQSTFPYNNWVDLVYPYITLINSTNNNIYPYFYNWIITRELDCATTVDSVTINQLNTPIVNLVNDTTLCSDSLILDAMNIGANYGYQWNTGATTASIWGTTSGTYAVTVTANGDCPVEDSMNLIVNTQPSITVAAQDRNVCSGVYPFVAEANGGTIQWIDSSSNVVALGDTFFYDIQDTTTFWYKASYYETYASLIGYPINGAGAFQGGASGRGIVFNTLDFIILDSVTINIDNTNFYGDIVLRNTSNVILASIPATGFSTVGQHQIYIGFNIPQGNGYSLRMENISGGNIQSTFPFNSWGDFNYPFMVLTGSTANNVYPYFYDWKVTRDLYCASDLDSVTINRLITPVVELGSDTSLCSDSITLVATNIGNGYDYIWTNGATTSTIIANATNNYAVTVSAGGNCPVVDSVYVKVRVQPTILQQASDTSICKGLYDVVASADFGFIEWMDSVGNIISIGDTLSLDVQSSIQIGYQSIYYERNLNTIGLMTNSVGGFFGGASGRGLTFDVAEYMVLDSVTINIDNVPFTGQVVLEDGTGATISTYNININTTSGEHAIPLHFGIQPGTNYKLRLTNITGGAILSTFPFNNWIDLNYPSVNITGSTTADVYPYFYNWKVLSRQDCASSRDSVIITILPTPSVNFEQDTIVCDNALLLDATFPGATYLWSTSDMTPTLTVSSENTYAVTVSINTCTAEDSIEVFFNPPPSIAVLSADTTTCKGLIDRIATGADIYKWYDDSIGGNYLGTGSIFMYNAQDSGTIWVEGQNFSNKVYSYGLDTGTLNNGGYFFPTETRGLVFNVDDDIFLESVSMYVDVGNTPFTGTVELWDENNAVIYSTAIPAVFIPGKQEVIINLNYQIPSGQNYKLMLPNYSVSAVLWEFPAAYPIVGKDLSIVSGTPGLDRYYYFYNWKVRETSCPSSRLPSVVNVLETPDIDFPKDSIVCGDSLILDLSASNIQTFGWSTGDTSSSITVDTNGVIYLTATIGSCAVTDSLNVFIVEPPDLIIPPNDTTVCQGNMTFYAAGNAAYYAWYDSLSSEIPFALGDSVLLNLQDSTTFWVEGIGFIPKSKPIGEIYNNTSNLNVWLNPEQGILPNRGMYFDVNEPIIFNSLKMYVDTATTGVLRIYKLGFPYFEKTLNLNNVGENLVQIDTLMEPGSYFIELSQKSPGKILTLSPYSNFNLISTPEITFTGSAPLANRYNYFFEWRISTPSCATDRLPVQVNVPASPQITMVADTATCTQSTLVLDPIVDNNPNYAYLWSTTSPDDTLVVSNSGYYSVTVTNDGICSSVQDVFVQFLNTPSDPAINDTSICSSGIVDLGYTPSDGIMVWYDSANLGEVVHITSPYSPYVADATNFWVDVAPRATTRIGAQAYPNPSQQSAYLSFIIANTFDVHKHAVLDSVAVYVDVAPATMNVVLMDSVGNVINSSSHTVTQAHQKVFLPLNYILPPGEKYQLTFSNPSSSFLVDQSPISAPSSSAGIATLTGTVFSGVNYNTFFDWHFSYAFPDCHSNADTFAVNVSIPVDLVDSIFTCDTAFVDITNPNVASYFWSIGQTTGAVTFLDAGLYFVTMSDGGVCTVVDSVEVVQPMPVGLPTGNANCGYLLATNYSMADATFNWNTGDTSNAITLLGTGTYTVTVTTNEGCVLYDTAAIGQIVQPPTASFQNPIDACYFDTLDAGFGGQAMTYMWSTGEQTQKIVVNTTGYYTVTVTHPLGCAGAAIAEVDIHTGPTASFLSFISGLSVGVTNTSVSPAPGTTFQWDFGDSLGYYSIGNPGHTYQDSNCYTVSLVVTDDCGADTAWQDLRIGISPGFVCDTTNSIAIIEPNMQDLGFDIIPNPNAGNFQIRLASALREESQMLLYDLNGRVVHEQIIRNLGQTQWDVQINNLSAGVYFIRLVNSKQSKTHRVVILRE